jgi:hypothetical protein
MSQPYFQFPLCALAFPASNGERLNNAISYCCVERGKRLWNKHVQYRELCRERPPDWCRSTLKKDAHVQAVLGCESLKVSCLGLETMITQHSAFARFVKDWEQRHGTDAKVRIATHFVFEARDHKGISYVELAVLCAIFSKIGANKAPVRITRDEIWRRALGYKSEPVFRVEAGNHAFKLTKRLVRSTIDRLHNRKFFARITFARRETYYSHRISSKALADRIFATKIQRSLARQARLHADADLTKRIQAERRKLAGLSATEGATETPP